MRPSVAPRHFSATLPPSPSSPLQVRSALRRWAAAQLASQPLFPEGCLVEKEARTATPIPNPSPKPTLALTSSRRRTLP